MEKSIEEAVRCFLGQILGDDEREVRRHHVRAQDLLNKLDAAPKSALRWSVRYQNTPFNYTTAAILLVDAATRADAFVVAYHELVRRGMNVNSSYIELESGRELDGMGFTRQEMQTVKEAGIADHGCFGTYIRSIKPYKVEAAARGKVVAG